MDGDTQAQNAIDVHQPFTKAENIQQLSEIDNVIILARNDSLYCPSAYVPMLIF